MQKELDEADLLKYENRQVVLNFYFDEELIDRQSFFFHKIELDEKVIRFMKNGDVFYTLFFDRRDCIVSDDQFPNFFIIKSYKKVTEIYFP